MLLWSGRPGLMVNGACSDGGDDECRGRFKTIVESRLGSIEETRIREVKGGLSKKKKKRKMVLYEDGIEN